MKCPDCGHVSDTALVKCSSCGEVFDEESLETLHHLEYLVEWIDNQEDKLDRNSYSRLSDQATDQLNSLRKRMLPALTPPAQEPIPSAEIVALPGTQAEIARERALIEQLLDLTSSWAGWRTAELGPAGRFQKHLEAYSEALLNALEKGTRIPNPPSTIDAINYALQKLDAWTGTLGLNLNEAKALEHYLMHKLTALQQLGPTPTAEVPPAVTAERPAVPKPALPAIDWAKWWQRTWGLVVSGALLRGLLYLGAFMIVVSAAVLVVRFWDIFPAAIQLVLIAAVPTAFYLIGWVVRTKLELLQAGTVLTGVGALLVAVDFAAVFQLGGLAGRVNPTLYWLVASLVCTAIYSLSAWRLPMEFFGYVALVGGLSTLLALGRLLATPLEWQIAIVAATAGVVIEGAARLGRAVDRWNMLAVAGRRFSQLILFSSIVLALFLPGETAFSQFGTFVFASVGYGILAWRFPHQIHAHATVWSSIGGFAFVFRLARLPAEWYGLAIGVLAILYILVEQRLSRRSPIVSTLRRDFSSALKLSNWALMAVVVLLGFVTLTINLWAGVLALTLAALTIGWSAFLYKKPVLVLVAGGLLIAPLSFALRQWIVDINLQQPSAWLMAGWAGLALAYIGLAAALRKAEQYGSWFGVLAHILAPAALIGLVVNSLQTIDTRSSVPTLASLGQVIVVYAASMVIHDSGRYLRLTKYLSRLPEALERTIFLWPLGFLLPVWIAIAWTGSVLQRPWLGPVLAGLGVAYVGLGEVLKRRKLSYRLPLQVYAYLLAVAGILWAFEDAMALLSALYLVVALLTALALVNRRIWETALAALLFIWPFQLTLVLSPLTTHAYSLAYALLASLIYIPLGLALDKTDRKFALPEYVIGYAVSAFAVVTSLLGRSGIYAVDVPWIGVATPLIISGMLAYSTVRFKSTPFAWAAVITFPIAFGQALTLLGVPWPYIAASWVGLAYVYLVLEQSLARLSTAVKGVWGSSFQIPLKAGVGVLGGLGLLLTVGGTLTLLSGRQVGDPTALILAQALGVGLTILAAWMYRTRIPLYIATFLVFFPYTSAWIVYGPNLKNVQFAWVWTGLAAIFLVAGFALDKSRVRYAHAPYLAGYLLAAFAITWSTSDRLVNLQTLAAVLVLMVLSQLTAHSGRHRTFDDFIRFVWRKPGTLAQRAGQMAFLWLAAGAFPVWVIQLLTYLEVSLAWRGLALALIAPLYIALGLIVKRAKNEYTWPLYGVGYALTALGAMLAFEEQVLAIFVLVLNTVVYASSAYIFRQAFWLYLSNTLLPVVLLLTLHHNQLLIAPWTAGTFMGLAFLYFVLGRLLDRWKEATSEAVSSFAVSFYIPGYLLSAIALAAASSERSLALMTYSAGVAFFALSAWVFRESVFLYPAAWLAAVPYYLVMTVTPLRTDWYGIGWLPLVAGYLVLGRFVFHRTRLGIKDLPTFLKSLANPVMPFYTLAYTLSVSMLALSQRDPVALTIAFTAGATIYFLSAALFRHYGWLYPGLLTAHLALAALYALRPSNIPAIYVTLPFLALTWVTALIGQRFVRRFPVTRQTGAGRRVFRVLKWEMDFGRWPSVGYVLTPSWSQPFFLFAAADLILWQVLGQYSAETAIVLAIGNSLLLGTFAMLWTDSGLAYGSLALFLLAVSRRLTWAGLPIADVLAWMAGIGFGFYMLAWIGESIMAGVQRRVRALRVWLRPLEISAGVLTAVAVLVTLPQIATFGNAAVASLAFAGVLYLTIAYRRDRPRLSYLGLAMLGLDWVFVLIDQNVSLPQLYAIPAGLYFAFVGHLERRRGRKAYAALVESFGIAVLLVTSFILSLDAEAGFPHFLLLLVEGLAVIWWGTMQRRRIPFFLGLGASALNVVAQVIVLVNVYDVQRWIIVLGVGLLLVTSAVFVERKREQIIARTQDWLEVLDAWD